MAANLEKELNKQEFGRDIASNAALLRLLVQLGREQRRENALQITPEMAQSKRTMELMAYIDAHLEEDLNIHDLAEQFYVSKYHMMRQFRKETGYSIYDYLSKLRLLHARELMQKGMRATEACYRSGFRCYSSFTRSYAKHFGSTPTGRVDRAHRRAEDGDGKAAVAGGIGLQAVDALPVLLLQGKARLEAVAEVEHLAVGEGGELAVGRGGGSGGEGGGQEGGGPGRPRGPCRGSWPYRH